MEVALLFLERHARVVVNRKLYVALIGREQILLLFKLWQFLLIAWRPQIQF